MPTSEYAFPFIYIEGVLSDKKVCLVDGKYIIVRGAGQECEKIFGLVPYERVIDYVDLVEAKTKASILMAFEEPEKPPRGYLIEKDTPLCLQEISGDHLYFLVSEGSRVEKGSRIAYIVTGKLEVRSVASLCTGSVAFIVDMPWETPRKALVVVVPSELREVPVRKAS
ncbi:MAG: DUF2118 domain-containing protein [Desulfurococcaceae archaeon]